MAVSKTVAERITSSNLVTSTYADVVEWYTRLAKIQLNRNVREGSNPSICIECYFTFSNFNMLVWWNGIHIGLKIQREQSLTGSNPVTSTYASMVKLADTADLSSAEDFLISVQIRLPVLCSRSLMERIVDYESTDFSSILNGSTCRYAGMEYRRSSELRKINSCEGSSPSTCTYKIYASMVEWHTHWT